MLLQQVEGEGPVGGADRVEQLGAQQGAQLLADRLLTPDSRTAGVSVICGSVTTSDDVTARRVCAASPAAPTPSGNTIAAMAPRQFAS